MADCEKSENDGSLHLTQKASSFIYFISILSAVGGFLFGYDTGVISGAMVQLRGFFKLNPLWQELIVSVAILSAWIFSLAGGYLADKYGRKRIIICASLMFGFGAVMMGVSDYKYELLIGRVIVGCGVGLASMTVPVYIAEVSPADLRGKLVTINNCSITMGQLIASIVDGIFSKNNEGWRFMLGLAAVPAAIQFVGFLFMPESPRWLTARKRYAEALKALGYIRGKSMDVTEEFNSIKSSCMQKENQVEPGSGPIIFRVLKTPHLRKALAVGCSLQIIQQIAGINTVMYYSATIIQMSGISGDSKVIWLSCTTAAMNAVCSLIALLFIERLGRRILTLASLAGVILSLSFLAVSFQVAENSSPLVVNSSYYNIGELTVGKCHNFRDCSSCVSSGECGFCYVNSDAGPQNGSCLACSGEYCSFALSNSTCSEAHLKEDVNHIWSNEWCPSHYSWMILLGLLLYLFCFAPGMGSTPWTVNSEIYPLWARSTCYSTATSFNWFFNFIISLSFLSLTEALSKAGAFWLYAGLSGFGFLFLFFMLPETRGKPLEEVEGLFERPLWEQMNLCCRKKNNEYVQISGFNRAYSPSNQN